MHEISGKSNFYKEIKSILNKARQESYKAINTNMVMAYWKIGHRIVEEEQNGQVRAKYGEKLLKELSKSLTTDFGKGFSYANLRNFRQFYLTYPDAEKCYALRSKLTWTHHRLIMRVEDEAARDYYIRECEDQNWSTRTLERNINTFYYQRLLSSRGNEKTNPVKEQAQIFSSHDFIKDPYVFEFLDLPEPIQATENEIETALIEHLQRFLLELGKGFSFVGRQFKISSETEHYYIDLVFYNYILKCFVLFDLKAGKLKHQDIGQMDMYRRNDTNECRWGMGAYLMGGGR